ncbi:putative feruloyl esterase A isoform A [Senna tora]|uniref:Putative feruloyl esterase A isoform A n=1 Tax=Senna tora TaxID=362788 RepID=A0A834X4C7_9FABA|nr:putative feruloyl esterase A isoform A [Senna tora]
MQSLQFRYSFFPLSPNLPHSQTPKSIRLFPAYIPRKARIFSFRRGGKAIHELCTIRCFSKPTSAIENVSIQKDHERPPFDINLAVILAGFAFEAYTSPPENAGRSELDAADCKTVYLSEGFVREIYDGQLFIKLKKGLKFPAMDLWGTSDPYVIIQMDSQIAKSKVKWGTKDPTWNEEFTFNMKQPPTKHLQIAAWDANLVTPHKRMGNAGVDLEWLCDGELHEITVELEGMGGGGKVQLEVKYKTFDEIDDDKKWWKIPFVSELLKINGIDSALRKIIGSDTVQARQFVEYAFGQLKSFNNSYPQKGQMSDIDKYDAEGSETSNDSTIVLDKPSQEAGSSEASIIEAHTEQGNVEEFHTDNNNGHASELSTQVGKEEQSDQLFWRNLADVVNHNIVQKLGLSVPEKLKWDSFDFLSKIGSQSRSTAESFYIESGLASPGGAGGTHDKTSSPPALNAIQSLPEVKKATQNLIKQTDSVLGGLMLLAATVSKMNKEGRSAEERLIKDGSTKVGDNDIQFSTSQKLPSLQNGLVLDEKKTEEMKELFSTAESAMEAWAMLATSLGHPSFIKSEFEKICFLDNATTDTQVAIWRDSARRRLVVAFRGTEQAKWKDLKTDLMLAPAGLNPERIGGDFKQEVQVHSGFLSAYDSVRTRIISLIRLAIGYTDDHSEPQHRWHVYITGHSLGGALATLLALELSSNQLAK